ncbi:MAG: hypothetical protein ACREX6_00925 [Casimicrobiaceae bacterium]
MKRARRQHRFATTPAALHPAAVTVKLPKRRNPIARSPLLGKGGAHGKSGGALRRRARMELTKRAPEDVSE